MLDAMEKKLDVDEEDEEEDSFEKDASLNHKSKISSVDELTLVAQALVLLIAAYDTTSATLAFAVWELAMNPDVQARLQSEIDQAYEDEELFEDDQDLSYTTVMGLKYLDMVVCETLRLHSPVAGIGRGGTKEHQNRGQTVGIKKGHEITGAQWPVTVE